MARKENTGDSYLQPRGDEMDEETLSYLRAVQSRLGLQALSLEQVEQLCLTFDTSLADGCGLSDPVEDADTDASWMR